MPREADEKSFSPVTTYPKGEAEVGKVKAKSEKRKDGRVTRWTNMSDEEKEIFRETMRKAMRKKFKDLVYRKMMREAKQTPEFRQLRSEIMIAQNADPKFKEKMRKNNYQNEEVKMRQGETFSYNWHNVKPDEEKEDFSRKRSILATAQLANPVTRETMRKANWNNKGVAAKRGKSISETWSKKSKAEIVEFAQRVMLNSNRKPNEHEKRVIAFLQKHQFDYKFVGDGKVFVAGRCPDFIHRAYNLIIEYDGTYWHSLPEKILSDKKRNAAYRRRGFKLLIVKTNDLKDEEKLFSKVKRFEAKYKTSATRRPRESG